MNVSEYGLSTLYALCGHHLIEVWFPDTLSQEVIDDLWTAGVDMDDWDYVVIGHPCILDASDEPIQYHRARLLTGVCENRWYRVTLRGREMAVGVAYHA